MSSRGIASNLLLALFASAIVASPCLARGMLSGTVKDRQGNPKAEVEVVLAPFENPALRTYTTKTNAKGTYVLMPENGDYKIAPRLAGFDLDRMNIHVTDDKRKPKYDWEGKIVPGQNPIQIGVSSGFRIEIDLVIAEQSVLRKEYSDMLLATVARAIEEGNQDKARSTIESLLANAPGDPVALTLRAYLEVEQQQFTEAEADLKQAIAKQPDFGDAWYQLAALYRRTDRPAEALLTFRKTTEVSSATEWKGKAWLNIGEMERDAARSDQAIEAFQKASELLPELAAPIATELSALYSATGNTEMAEKWMAKVEAAGQVDPTVLYNVAVTHFNRKEYEKAIEGFKKVIAVSPGFSEAYRNLGFVFLSVGDREGAKTNLRKYLELAPQASDQEDVKALLKTIDN